MGQRLDLQALLEEILGSKNVYFQPPENVKLNYPCIIYSRERITIEHADNIPYLKNKRYQVIVIYRDPDSDIPDKISEIPTCIFDRHYVLDNLYHDAFNLYF